MIFESDYKYALIKENCTLFTDLRDASITLWQQLNNDQYKILIEKAKNY